MNSESQPFQDAGAAAYGGPGQMLQQARQQANVSREQLSSLTRIPVPTLEALENEDFGALLEPVYVRGYYRKCAKVLELDEQPFVDAYEAIAGPMQVQAPSKLRLASDGDFRAMPRVSARFAIIVPVVAVILSVLIWLASGPSSDQDEPSLASTEDFSLSQLEVGAEAEPAAVEVTETPAANAATATEQVVPVGEPEVTAAEVPADTSTELRLQFDAISWARVEDSTGRSLLSGVISAGENKTLEGTPPYSVFLGNAPGVKVRYQGRLLDLKPFTRGNSTARFSVPING